MFGLLIVSGSRAGCCPSVGLSQFVVSRNVLVNVSIDWFSSCLIWSFGTNFFPVYDCIRSSVVNDHSCSRNLISFKRKLDLKDFSNERFRP